MKENKTMTQTITHLIDEDSPVSVTRFLETLIASPAIKAEQKIVIVKHGALFPPKDLGDVIISHLSICKARLPQLLALRARHPWTPMVHVEHRHSERFIAKTIQHPAPFKALLRIAYTLFDRIVAVSETQRRWMAREKLAPEITITAIPPTTDLSPLLALKEPAPGGYRIAFIGALDHPEGCDALIEGFLKADLPQGMLDIWGEGPERAALTTLAGGDQRIRFHGLGDPAAAIAAADVVAIPSAPAPYDLTALEARAAGRLTLISDAPELGEHVRDGAVAVPAGKDAWAAALRRAPLLGQPTRLAYARRRAIETEQNFREAWAALFRSFAPKNNVIAGYS